MTVPRYRLTGQKAPGKERKKSPSVILSELASRRIYALTDRTA